MTTKEAISVLRNTAWLGTDKEIEQVEKAIDTVEEAYDKGFNGCSECAKECLGG